MNNFASKSESLRNPTSRPEEAPLPTSRPTPITDKVSQGSLEHETIGETILRSAEHFLGEQKSYLSTEALESAIKDAVDRKDKLSTLLKKESILKTSIIYDKYGKDFKIGNQKATLGEIVASRHIGFHIESFSSAGNSAKDTELRNLCETYAANDTLYNSLNRSLGTVLAETMESKDTAKAEAYREIVKRTNTESKQLGVIAEQIMIGIAETIAIDKPQLGLSVIPGNAYQDVEQKIDFILATKQKRRGVGFDNQESSTEEKTIGIQFTTNETAELHKGEQIRKAKERGVDVDDIIYVSINGEMLAKALVDWENDKKPIKGPWHYLPRETRYLAIKTLFHSVLAEEQEVSLLKSFVGEK